MTPTPNQIIEATARRFGVTAEDIRGRGRSKHLALSRQVAMWATRQVMGHRLSSVEIGRAFDRDHSTVLQSCVTVSAKARDDIELAEDMVELLDEIRGAA